MFVLDHSSLRILDVNKAAVHRYGIEREEFLKKNIKELGKRFKREELVGWDQSSEANDKIWLHSDTSGKPFYVQFTHHLFNYEGQPARLAVAHNVSLQVKQKIQNRAAFPRIRNRFVDTPLAVIEWTRELTVKNWSKQAEKLFGWTEEEVVGDPNFLDQFVYEEELEDARKRFRDLEKNHHPSFLIEGRNYTKSGDILYCEWYNSAVYNSNGKLITAFSLVHDISDRKQSEKLYRALSERSLVGVYLIKDWKFEYVNLRLAEIFGYDIEELKQMNSILELVHPEDKKIVERNIEKRITGNEESIRYRFRGVHKNGQTLYLKVFGTRLEYEGASAVVGTLVDLTGNKLTFERYRSSLKSFEDLFNSISDAIYILNQEGEFLEVNQGALDMYGYNREEFLGKTPAFLAAPAKVDMEETLRKIKMVENGAPQQFEWWGRRKNGEIFPKEVVLNAGTYFGKEVIIATGRDITDRYEAHEKIRRNEELFRQLFQNAHIGIAMMDKHREIKIINSAFEDLFGYELEEIKGLDVDQLIVPEGKEEEARELSDKTFEGKSAGTIARRKHKDGSLVDVLIYGAPVIVDEKIHAIFGMYVDITDRIRAEEKVRKSLKEKEVLLAEIHHRVKNNLAVITGLLELQSYNTNEESARQILRESQLRINSIALIHEKLYQNEDLAEITFGTYIRELTEVISASMTDVETEVSIEISDEPVLLPITKAIPCGLILNEVLTNAYKHAFEGRKKGKIKIELLDENNTVVLRINDNGIGFPDNLDMENPTTLGLKLIRTLTTQLEGTSSFSNNNGTCFELSFEV